MAAFLMYVIHEIEINVFECFIGFGVCVCVLF